MATNEIKLKICIEDKEASAAIYLTDLDTKELDKKFLCCT